MGSNGSLRGRIQPTRPANLAKENLCVALREYDPRVELRSRLDVGRRTIRYPVLKRSLLLPRGVDRSVRSILGMCRLAAIRVRLLVRCDGLLGS